MALAKGSITVNPDGSHTSSGLAGRIFDAYAEQSFFPTAPVSTVVAFKEGFATLAQILADAVVDEITENAEVTVTVDPLDVGLQTSTSPGSPTAGPTPLPVELRTKGTVA